MKALLLRFLVSVTPVLLERLFAWVTAKAKELMKKKEQERRADELNNSKDEDEFDRASDKLP